MGSSSNKCHRSAGVFVVSPYSGGSPQASNIRATHHPMEVIGQLGTSSVGASFSRPVSWALHLLVRNLGSSPGEIRKRPPYVLSKTRLKEETDHPGLAGGRFNEQGNLLMRLILGATE